MLKKTVLFVIRIAKRLFYNTPIHRLAFVTVLYEKLFHLAFNESAIETVHYMGSTYEVPARDITLLPSLLNDNYEKMEFELLKDCLKKGSTLIDVGANIGLFSVFASKLVGKNGRVFGFEPEPGNYSSLLRNIELNAVKNITPIKKAVGEKKDTLRLYLEANSIGTHSLLKSATHGTEFVDVDVVTLDDYFKSTPLKNTVMKVDVEGYEPMVLKGAKKTLKSVDFLFFEIRRKDLEQTGHTKTVIDLLAGFPYLYNIDEKQHSKHRISADVALRKEYANLLASKVEIA